MYKPAHVLSVEVGYVLPPSIKVVDTPAEVRIIVGSLTSGERVEITRRTRNWAQIRTAANLTGWVENKELLDSQIYEGGQKLLRDLKEIPAMADGHTSGIVNLRLEPARDAAQLAQLPENLDPPEQRAPYAQGANMVSWVVLKKVDDAGQAVPEYLTADRLGTQEADFSHIRVFTWWIKNHKYVTAYVESNLNGYFPIRVAVVNGTPYFRLRLMDDQGQKFQKVYGLFDTITRTVGTVPGWESDAMPESPEAHHHRGSGRRRG
jgi:hypothetical protein